MNEKVLILDCGSQYTQLIGRKVRELNIYSEIIPFHAFSGVDSDTKAVIISGSPFSVNDTASPAIDLSLLRGKVPLLGVCYGAQYMVEQLGGKVSRSQHREYGRAQLSDVAPECVLFDSVSTPSQVWMSHGDTITEIPDEIEWLGSTDEVRFAAFQIRNEKTFGIQFHPEVYHSLEGSAVLKNFLVHIAGFQQTWTPTSFVEESVSSLRETIGNDNVILGLSGGVDSSVAAMLLHKAIGKQLYCVFVNNGLLRKGEFDEVLKQYETLGLQVEGVDASAQFLERLTGVSDPEKKRKIIGATFIDVFDEASKKTEGVRWLAQGTIYPDVIESVSHSGGPSATIKSHHNVGGLPDFMKLKIVEPLRLLFKDEVRRIGRSMDMPEPILGRHPFPGPGLAIRILGDITAEKVRILQEVDSVYIAHLKSAGWYDKIWQAGAILLPVQSVGVMGDERTYEQAVALRAVESTDGMTADWVHIPYDLLGKISNAIINQVKGVNRVVYDISSKPPATIEWE